MDKQIPLGGILKARHSSLSLTPWVRDKQVWLGKFLIFLTYLALSIIFTFPLITHMGNFLIGYPMDGYLYIWNIDVFWQQIAKFQNPFLVKQIFFPVGANLIFHTYAPLISILGGTFVNHKIIFLNSLIILSSPLAALSTYYLLRSLKSTSIPAFMAGLIYGFSPVMISFIVSQHFYFAFAAPFLPLAILYCIKYAQTVKAKYIYFLCLSFWLAFFVDYYTAILLGVISGIILVSVSGKKILRAISPLFVSLILPALILLFLTTRGTNPIQWATPNNWMAATCNTNLIGFLTPGDNNLLLRKTKKLFPENLTLPKNYDTPSYFSGWGIFLLSLFLLVKQRKNKYFQIFGLILFMPLLLSLGTVVRFGNVTLLLGVWTPFYYFSKLPFLGLIDCPLRFPIAMQLGIAGIIGLGKPKRKIVFLGLLFSLFLVEYGHFGNEINNVKVPDVYQLIANDGNTRTVLELPSGLAESKGAFGYDWSIQALHSQQMYWQTIYKKPRVGGYVSRIPESTYQYFRSEPIISDLFVFSSLNGVWPNTKYSEREVVNFIDKFNLGYIVLSPNPRQLGFAKVIKELFEGHITKKAQEDNFILYTISP